MSAVRDAFRSPPLAPHAAQILIGLLAVGAVGRIVVGFATLGVENDIHAYEQVLSALRDQPWELYSTVNLPDVPRWPYPGGFLPWIYVSGWLHDWTGLRFDGFVQLAPIAADLALAWVVQAYLGQRGADDRTRLIAAGLVALGTSFAVISGYHGQLDSLAILFPLLGLWYWERTEGGQRAVVAGLLIGLGGAIKLPPLIVLLALLPTGRSWRERGVLFASAAAVLLVSLAPFLVADLDGTIDGIRSNKGLPGFGGISLLVQPEFAARWLGTDPGVQLTAASEWLFDHSAGIAAIPLLATAAFVFWRRLAAVEAAVLLFLAVYAFGINFAFQYVVAGLAIFLVAGRIWQVAAVQAALLVPTLLLYVRDRRDLPLENVYVPIMIAIWLASVAWFAWEVYRLTGSPRRAIASPRARSTN